MHVKGRGRVVPILSKESPDDKILAQKMEQKNNKKDKRYSYLPPRRMCEIHPQHHLACLKSHHFLCPYSFNIQIISEILT